jgi:hypothetical protein
MKVHHLNRGEYTHNRKQQVIIDVLLQSKMSDVLTRAFHLSISRYS